MYIEIELVSEWTGLWGGEVESRLDDSDHDTALYKTFPYIYFIHAVGIVWQYDWLYLLVYLIASCSSVIICPLQIERKDEKPPVTTVFVGNISDRAPDSMIRQMLQVWYNNWAK